MIRDPSDGSVRETELCGKSTINENPPHVQHVELSGNSGQLASGLPLESTKPDRKERLDKSREWLKQYFKRNPEQGT